MRSYLEFVWDSVCSDGLAGKLFGVFHLIGLAVILYLIFYFVDTVGIEARPQVGVEKRQRYVEEYWQPVTTTVNNVTTTTMQHYPEEFWIHVELETSLEQTGCKVPEGTYHDFMPGNRATVYIVRGRISGGAYCEGLVH